MLNSADPEHNLFKPSFLLPKGSFAIKIFNNLYTQTAYFNQSGIRKNDGRSTYFTSILQANLGISRRWNIGIDVIFKSVNNGLVGTSALKVFSFQSNDDAHTGFTAIGTKFKFAPNSNSPNISVQTAIYFPLGKDNEGQNSGRPFLDYDRFHWINQLFFDKKFSNKWQLFAGTDLYARFDNALSQNGWQVGLPLRATLNYFPLNNVTGYTLFEFSPTLGQNIIESYYAQAGIGFKYRLWNSFEIELLATDFFAGKSQGAGATFNLGLCLIR